MEINNIFHAVLTHISALKRETAASCSARSCNFYIWI